MKSLLNNSHKLRKHLLLVAGVFLTAYFSYHAMYGTRSFDHWEILKRQIANKTSILEEIRSERELLDTKVRLMRPNSISRDLLEERASVILGFRKKEEIVVPRN